MGKLSTEIKTHFVAVREYHGSKGCFDVKKYFVTTEDYEAAKIALDAFRQIVIPDRGTRVNADMIHEIGPIPAPKPELRLMDENPETPEQAVQRKKNIRAIIAKNRKKYGLPDPTKK